MKIERKREMTHAVVCGAGGFIGSHLVKRLKADGYWCEVLMSRSPSSV
jgi:nucleoside-diphosphate-sugar epimerase